MRRELLMCLVVGCQSAPDTPPPEEPPAASPPPRAKPLATTTPAAASPSAQPTHTAPPPSFAGGRFPPPDFEPPHPQSAKEGDGRWTPLGNASAGDRAAEAPPLLFTTVAHPHRVSRFDSVTIVAIDLARTEIHFVPGAQDPGADKLDPPAGLVPRPHQDALLAVFNGGWLPKHGNWGMMTSGHVLVPPREEGCTIALMRDGHVRIANWKSLAHNTAEMRAYRQTPPCLIEGAKLHPLLEAHNEKPWGGHNPNDKTRRRSSIAIDASGRVLFYGFGVEVGAELLARGLQHAGAVAAAELDINWTWTRFLLVGKPTKDADLQITSTLVPKMTHTKRGYIVRRDERDFFYITRRSEALGGSGP